MPQFREKSSGPRTRFLLPLGITLLACLLVFSGCTRPAIPSPAPASTTAPPQATRAPAPPPVTTIQATTRGPDYLAYTNSLYGFSMSYPVEWTKEENTGGSVVVFTSPSTGSISDIPATMRVNVQDLTANPMSLAQFRAAELAKVQGLDNFNMVLDLPYKELNGWKIGYTYLAGTLIKTFEAFTIRGNKAYTITFSSRDDQFATYTVPSDTMFKSFKITG